MLWEPRLDNEFLSGVAHITHLLNTTSIAQRSKLLLNKKIKLASTETMCTHLPERAGMVRSAVEDALAVMVPTGQL